MINKHRCQAAALHLIRVVKSEFDKYRGTKDIINFLQIGLVLCQILSSECENHKYHFVYILCKYHTTSLLRRLHTQTLHH